MVAVKGGRRVLKRKQVWQCVYCTVLLKEVVVLALKELRRIR
jgi:hypothetical protein